MLSLREAQEVTVSVESATSRLIETILGNDDRDLAETLRTIASEIGVSHIAYLRLSPDKSPDICLLVAVVTVMAAPILCEEIHDQRPRDFLRTRR